MLQQLDVAIALVVVLLAVSLCVTIVVQMVSALFNLRGAHLRAGLTTLLETVDPELKAHAQSIVDEVLMHPLVSDSAFSKRSPFLANTLIGSSMTRPWQRASAIRANELKGILRALLEDPANTSRPWRAPLAAALAKDSTTLFSGLSGIEGRIDAWFDTTMERVSQRFTLNVRSWTVSVSIALAVLIHFDAIDLYNRVSTDNDLRDRLVQLSPAVQADAQAVQTAPDPAAYQAAASD